jgi:hypothetical protein
VSITNSAQPADDQSAMPDAAKDTTQDTTPVTISDTTREDFSEYVAQLQLHMALQARKLVPGLSSKGDRREALLYETQATIEKLVSRQSFVK